MLVRDIRPESFARRDQSAACFTCHQNVRAQTHRLSAHPMKEGKVVCSDCHNAHGSTTDHLLAQETLNETCYECHAEKRGPFLWEHQPARDDCSTCHVPPYYTDNLMHNLKTERFFAPKLVNGRLMVGDGPIKTFPLRGIKDSPPYLHDDRLLTLEDTVEFFNLVLELKLVTQEKTDLVAFLRAL